MPGKENGCKNVIATIRSRLNCCFRQQALCIGRYEDIYLHAYETPKQVNQALTSYFGFYSTRRPHQALEQRTPDAVYFASGELKESA